jgi:UDP-sulfoquinovose synthase
MTESLSVQDIADTVVDCYDGPATIDHIANPRVEADEHYYRVTHTALTGLGLRPHLLCDTLIESMFAVVERHRDRIDADFFTPTVQWTSTANQLCAPHADGMAGQNGHSRRLAESMLSPAGG